MQKYKVILNWPKTANKDEILEILDHKSINGEDFYLATNGSGWEDWVNSGEFHYFTEPI